MKMDPVSADCPRCTGTGRESFYCYDDRIKYDVDRAWGLVGDGRAPVELEPEDVDWSVRVAHIDAPHVDHVDPSIPGLIAHSWLTLDDGEVARGHVLIDGHHRAARCLRDGRPFFVYVLSEEESDSVLLRHPDRECESPPTAPGCTAPSTGVGS